MPSEYVVSEKTGQNQSRWAKMQAKMSVRLNRIASGLGKRVEVHRLNKIIFNWPMPRQEWIDGKFVEHVEKNDEAWVELFIDLIYVVLLSSLANQLEIGKMSVELFVKISSSFWIICLTRQAIDEYSNRFYCHDFVQKCIYLVYTIAVFIQASSIQFDFLHQLKEAESHPQNDEHVITDDPIQEHHARVFLESESEQTPGHSRADRFYPPSKLYSSGFAVSLLITRICLLLMYAVVLYRHDVARKQFQFDVARWVITSVLMIVLLIMNALDINSNMIDLAFFVAVVGVELVAWIISRVFYRHLFKFPVNLETLQARWGVWVMIVIGESVIQLLHSFLSLDGIYLGLRFMGVSLLLLFTLAMQYFDACQVQWYEHALTKSAIAGVSWIWLHVPMTLYLFRLGVWLKILATNYIMDSELSHSDSVTFCLSLGLVSGCVTLIRMSNSLPDSSISLVEHLLSSESRSVLIFGFRFVVSGVQFGLGYTGFTSPLRLILVQCGLTLITTGLDVANDITTASENTREEQAKQETHVAVKSLKHFPRQWSQLQLVRKESLLEMNLLSDTGDIVQSIQSAKSHLADEQAAAGGDPGSSLRSTLHSAHSLININLRKLLEAELVKAETAPNHFDGLLLRRSSANRSSFFRTPSQLVGAFMPTLVEKKELESSSKFIDDDNFADCEADEEEPRNNHTSLYSYSATKNYEPSVSVGRGDSFVGMSGRQDSLSFSSGHGNSSTYKSQRIACKGPTPRTSSGPTTTNSSFSTLSNHYSTRDGDVLDQHASSDVLVKPGSNSTSGGVNSRSKQVNFPSDRIVPLECNSDEFDEHLKLGRPDSEMHTQSVTNSAISVASGGLGDSTTNSSAAPPHSTKLEGMGSFTSVTGSPAKGLASPREGMSRTLSTVSAGKLELSNFNDGDGMES